MNIFVLWLVIGFVGSLIALFVFRRDGTTTRKGELYFALIGPLFGPIISILLILDLFRRKGKV